MSSLVLYFYEEPLLPVPHINAIGNGVLQKGKKKGSGSSSENQTQFWSSLG
jgi:hypothetical protein